MDGQTPEHFLEVYFRAREFAARQTNETMRDVWLRTMRDIETILADHPMEIARARDRLAVRQDDEGRAMYAYVADLAQFYEAADREARDAIERARRL